MPGPEGMPLRIQTTPPRPPPPHACVLATSRPHPPPSLSPFLPPPLPPFVKGSSTEFLIAKFLGVELNTAHLDRMRAAGKELARLTDCPKRNGKEWYEEGY